MIISCLCSNFCSTTNVVNPKRTSHNNCHHSVFVSLAGLICVVPLHDNWYRAEVHAVYEDQDEALIRLVDIGGFYKVGIDTLRQIRVDFATIPFQATDCRLANVIPINEEEGWSEEAVTFFRIISEGSSLQSTVVGHSHVDEISLVHLYKFAKDHVSLYNLIILLIYNECVKILLSFFRRAFSSIKS